MLSEILTENRENNSNDLGDHANEVKDTAENDLKDIVENEDESNYNNKSQCSINCDGIITDVRDIVREVLLEKEIKKPFKYEVDDVSASYSAYTLSGHVVTGTASASATSEISYEDAWKIAYEEALSIAKNDTRTLANLYTQIEESEFHTKIISTDFMKSKITLTENLIAINAKIENITASTGTMDYLQVANELIGTASIGYLQASTGTMDYLQVANELIGTGNIGYLQASRGTIDYLQVANELIGTGNIGYLQASRGTIDYLQVANELIGTGSVGYLQASTGTIDYLKVSNELIGTGNIGYLQASTGTIDYLKVANEVIGAATIGTGSVGYLQASTGTIDYLKVGNELIGISTIGTGSVGYLQASTGSIQYIQSDKATIGLLASPVATIGVLASPDATIDRLIITPVTGTLTSPSIGSSLNKVNNIYATQIGGTLTDKVTDLYVDKINGQTVASPDYKTFVIEHPLDNEKYLVHTCLEGPEAGVYYRGQGTVTNGSHVTISLPDYVSTFATNFTIQITPIYNPLAKTISTYASTTVSNNTFDVYGENGSFYWLVQGERGDGMQTEFYKKDITVKGDGPYTYFVPN